MPALRRTTGFIGRHKWPIIIALVGAFLFYWYQMRPIIVFRSCATQASADARMLLKSKADVSQGTSQGDAYNKLIEKNLYLRTDYESFLMKCLTFHGLQIEPLDPGTPLPPEAVTE